MLPKAHSPASLTISTNYLKTTDILNTKLEISFNWDSAFVIGKAYIMAKPYAAVSDQIVLNAVGFRVNDVSLVRNKINSSEQQQLPLNYSYNGNELTIQLDKRYSPQEDFTILIDYVAMPDKLKVGVDIGTSDSRGLYFVNPRGRDKNRPVQVWSQGETDYNSTWFPTINGPQEKMSQQISITVPDKMKTLSNGKLDFSINNSNGTRTDTWKQEKQHSTYLTMIAAGDFSITKDVWRGKEVSYFMEPEFASNAERIFGKTPQMMEFFSEKLGIDFPWDKYSQIVVRDFVSGAMENTSATVFFDKMNMDEGQLLDENYESIISHELFHQWFGDLVTCKSWGNLALNESFASYGEYLWNEFKYGRDFADYEGMKQQQTYLINPKNSTKSLIRNDYPNPDDMFDNVTYEKGSRVLHMLRKTIGDEAFFKGLTLYLNRFAYKTADVQDLRKAFEDVSREDLKWFFDQWFLSPGHPQITIQTKYDAVARRAIINLQQMQDLAKMPLYKLPLAVDIYYAGKVERKEITFDKKQQTFSFPVDSEPDLINVDAEKYLLAEKSEDKSLNKFAFQYEHAPLFLDRYEAVLEFIANKRERLSKLKMIEALQDKSWYIRKLALEFVPNMDKNQLDLVYPMVQNMALKDERSYVRAAAITTLNKVFKNRDIGSVLKTAASDKSPTVIKALSGL